MVSAVEKQLVKATSCRTNYRTLSTDWHLQQEIIGTRRQPSEQFLRWLKGHGEPSRAEVPEKRPSWIRELKDSDYWLWGEFFGLLGVEAALVAFYIDIGDRKLQREAINIDLAGNGAGSIIRCGDEVLPSNGKQHLICVQGHDLRVACYCCGFSSSVGSPALLSDPSVAQSDRIAEGSGHLSALSLNLMD